jgi:hypothetical protein
MWACNSAGECYTCNVEVVSSILTRSTNYSKKAVKDMLSKIKNALYTLLLRLVCGAHRKVYVLDFRRVKENDRWECTTAFIGSSVERCVQFIKDNPDYGAKESRCQWWAVYTELVDFDMFQGGLDTPEMELYYFNIEGKRIQCQPSWSPECNWDCATCNLVVRYE